MKLENISKPKIVDFLRVCDRKNWIFPRIRYASVRSKPTLLSDIRRHFQERMVGPLLELVPQSRCVRCPLVQYDFDAKTFLFDGSPIDLPRAAKVEFRIVKGPVTVSFGNWSAPTVRPSNCGAPVALSQTPRTRSASGSSNRSPQSDCSTRTPTKVFSCHHSLGTRSRASNPDYAEPVC